jgi:staphylococcal nuclease domain-containing protein 1
MTTQAPPLQHGIVKQVLSGDTVVIRGQPKGGPPPERTLCLSNVIAPKLARRPNPNAKGLPQTQDEPYAWESREFLRKKIIGKEVSFTSFKINNSDREYGVIYLGRDTTSENITELMVSEGLVELKKQRSETEESARLVGLEEAAKAGLKGKWAPPEEHPNHIRSIKWSHDNLHHLVDSFHKKPIDAVIEHVRDGCTVRAFLLPTFDYVTIMLSGIKCPMFKIGSDGSQSPEQFAEEAKYFTEVRLLQRDVQIVLESASNQSVIGSVLHPNGNIAELLLRQGFARIADWSMGVVSQGTDNLKQAEKTAKEQKLRLWKDYTPSASTVDIKDKNFQGKVVEIINGDGMVLKLADGSFKKIFLASVRPPRQEAAPAEDSKGRRGRPRPLYDVPYMFEAREFLRKKVIGKKVNVTVDYIQPKTDDYPEKTCCTVTINNINIAEALIGRGLGDAVRYRQDDDQRSSAYYELLAAEERAKKKELGKHSKKGIPTLRVADVSGDLAKSKQFLPFLQRAGKVQGIVEFVASGSRLRIYIPKETVLITFLLSGIECPRGSRPDPANPGKMIPSDPFGDEAAVFTKEHTLQREVEVQVESMDKGGNFIGWLFVDNLNLSAALVENGLSKVHFTAERSNYYQTLLTAETNAKKSKKNIWSLVQEEPKEVVPENEPQERTLSYKTVVVTEVSEDLSFYAQNVETGPQLEKLMDQLRNDLTTTPPLPGAYTPRKGDLCAAKFSDGEWYRARIEKAQSPHVVHVLYIDFGNRDVTDSTKLATLPPSYHSLAPQAGHYQLACIQLPPDEEDKQAAVDAFYNDVLNKQCLLNVEYKRDGVEFVSLMFADNKEDVAQSLLTDGMVVCENRKEKRLNKIITEYKKAQQKAKDQRLNLWRYGDFTEDDAREFGYQS